MKKLLKIFSCTAFAAWLTAAGSLSVSAEEPTVSAYAYSLYCTNTGEFLMAHNGEERLPMASTTKIMTAILGLEMLQKNEDDLVVTINENMYAEGSSMYLAAGEKLSMKDLVGGMLMVSGNDAANAVALTVGGSFEGFGELMNQKAADIGLLNTSFVTPSGLDAENHYTTACDLAKLMEYCMENSLFREIDSSQSIDVNFIEPAGKKTTYYNENRLLREYEYCVAGKTGYTDKAGRTLVSCAEKDGIRLIAVTLNDGDDWNDHKKMFDYGFDVLTMTELDLNFDDLKTSVVGGVSSEIKLDVSKPPAVCTSGGDNSDVELVYKIPRFVYAPIAKGERVGEIEYYKNGVYAGSSEVTSADDIEYSAGVTDFVDNVVSFFRRLINKIREASFD